MSALSNPGRQSPFSFKSSTARVHRWAILSCCMLLCPAPVVFALPDRFIKGPMANSVATVYIVLWLLSLVHVLRVSQQERTALVNATLEAPEAQYLPMYISAYSCDGEKMHERMAPIVCELLGRMSEDELTCLPDSYWIMLCPHPKITPTGYSAGERVGQDDPVHAAVFSAIRRLKRMASLPCIEGWMQHLDPERHSETYVRTLTECYETLVNHPPYHDLSVTLLRPSTEPTSSEELLRPVSGTHRFDTDSGVQLLRASNEAETSVVE